MGMKALELTEQRFSRWTVLERVPGSGGSSRWRCRCDCGTEKVIVGADLRRGRSRSCRPCAMTKPDAGYNAAHLRVRKARGPATAQSCIDCSQPAAEWSYDRTDPAELTVVRQGYEVPYSLDPNHYSPRCLSCHRTADRAT